MVKESLNRASPSSTECSRELLRFSPQMIHFILGAGHHLWRPGLFSVTLVLPRMRSAHSLQNFGMCTFGKVESSYGIWLLQGAWGPSETLLVFPREKGNGLVLSKLSPIAQAWSPPPSLMIYLFSGTRSRFPAIRIWQKVNSAPAPSSWWGW